MTSEQAQSELLRLLGQLSPGDFSMLELGLKHPPRGMEMMTMPESANDVLWREFASLGWMTRRVKDLGPPEQPFVQSVLYEITPAGHEAINALIVELVRRQREAHAVKMTKLYNELYPVIVPQIGHAVRTAGGREIDLSLMLVGIVAETLNSYASPENRRALLDRMYEIARERLR